MDLKQNKTIKSWSEEFIEKMKNKGFGIINCAGLKPFPLRLAAEGEYVTIFSLKGGKGFHERLAGLGLHRGEQVEVVQNNMNGKLLLRHGNTRFFLGGGMAQKIHVIIPKK